jgi:hypothetical protein
MKLEAAKRPRGRPSNRHRLPQGSCSRRNEAEKVVRKSKSIAERWHLKTGKKVLSKNF